MERERFFSEPEDAPSRVPDTIPDELIAAHQADARAVVAATVTPERAARLRGDHGSTAVRVERKTLAAVRHASRPRTREQRTQAVLALLAGYLGLAGLTGWWWSLAQTTGDSLWWTVTVVGAGGLSVAALALLGWVVIGLVRRRRRLTVGTRH